MKYIAYKYIYNNEIFLSGTTTDLYRLYQKFTPGLNSDNSLFDICSVRDIYYGQLQLYYKTTETEEDALKLSGNSDSDITGWNLFVNKNQALDDLNYKNKLLNRIRFLKYQVVRDLRLHQFLIDNFNSLDDHIYYSETLPFPDNWSNMKYSEKERYVKQNIDTNKRYKLSRKSEIRVYNGFSIEDGDDRIEVKLKISVDKIPYLVCSMYNELIFTSHDLNILLKYLGEKMVMVKSEEIPFYLAIKPLQLYYTEEKLKDVYKNKNT